jgi:hypothetical protein
LRRFSLGLLLVGALLFLGAGTTDASQQSTVSCGDTISSPGTYYLAGDCSGGGNFDGIKITASHVKLFLRGHTMTGLSSTTCSQASCRGINVSATSNVAVLGPGTITNYYIGMNFEFSTGAEAGSLKALGNSFGTYLYESSGITVWSSILAGNSHAGAVVQGNGNRLLSDDVNGNGIYGIEVDSTGNRIASNNAHGNGVYDLYDGNGGCDSNVWFNDRFGTANQSCIH